MNDDLKPCPFCGGEAVLHACAELENETARVVYSGKTGAHCTICRVATLPYETEIDAISAWNRRADNTTD